MPRDVDTVVSGIAPTREGILKLAGQLQAKGMAAEAAEKMADAAFRLPVEGEVVVLPARGVMFDHAEVAYLVRTMQAISGLLGELAQIIENQSNEIQIQQSLPDFPKPKILMQ